MLVGYGNGADKETILVEKHHPFKLDFVATMFLVLNLKQFLKSVCWWVPSTVQLRFSLA